MIQQAARDPHEALSPEDAAALATGRHSDPFAVLGPHRDGDAWRVIVWLPGITQIDLLPDHGETLPMQPDARTDGLFSARLPTNQPYKLRATPRVGDVWTFEDPYRFGPVLGESDEYFLSEGTHQRLWHALGAHVMTHEGAYGTHFALWAPNAARVSVVGAFNAWDGRRHVMRRRGTTGVWEIFLPEIGDGAAYKYEILDQSGRVLPLKADPLGFGAEHAPATASVVRDIAGYGWSDQDWMKTREAAQTRTAPISIYEVHLGSWRRKLGDSNRALSYKELADELVGYASEMGFTHIELLPISEHPFEGSWGYQPVGLYAPTIRHGPPQEFRDLIAAAHEAGLGVILDWVPAHFPSDAHGLARFDGTPLYEHADPREGFHQDWNTLIFNYGRSEVANFLVSNALYWLEEYHLDGLRVDAVASMLYRDYSRPADAWIPNTDGGRENYEAIDLIRRMNSLVYGQVPGILTAAEESTSFPQVTTPVNAGGLGFGFKWNMGWMNDTLDFISRDPVHRRYHYHQMTFGLNYAFSENFILPISHDEVVHGKGSMWDKMPGDDWQKAANLRTYYGFMWGHPGKKLLFMGSEFGQRSEWNHDAQLDWAEASHPDHAGIQNWVRDLNFAYRTTPALHAKDCVPDGFAWIVADDPGHAVLAWARYGGPDDPPVVVICNFTPVQRDGWRVGLPRAGRWREFLNSDATPYGGAGKGNMGQVIAEAVPAHGQAQSATLTLPALSAVFLVYDPLQNGAQAP